MWIDVDDGTYDYTRRVHGYELGTGTLYLGFECNNEDRIVCVSPTAPLDLYNLLQHYQAVWIDKPWKEFRGAARQIFKIYVEVGLDEVEAYLETLKALEEGDSEH